MATRATSSIPLWRLRTLRRTVFESFGSDRFSRPSPYHLERKLLKYFDGPGVFVEAGAVDGFFESNTYYLERFLDWRGILIEPLPAMFRRIRVNRPSARAFNCALVAFDYARATVTLTGAHALTRVSTADEPHGGVSGSAGIESGQLIEVPARTLQSVLQEANVNRVDLLSLDVEGYERQVLLGLDFGVVAPRYILVECLDEEKRSEIEATLQARYQLVEQFSHRDFLFRVDGADV